MHVGPSSADRRVYSVYSETRTRAAAAVVTRTATATATVACAGVSIRFSSVEHCRRRRRRRPPLGPRLATDLTRFGLNDRRIERVPPPEAYPRLLDAGRNEFALRRAATRFRLLRGKSRAVETPRHLCWTRRDTKECMRRELDGVEDGVLRRWSLHFLLLLSSSLSRYPRSRFSTGLDDATCTTTESPQPIDTFLCRWISRAR